MKFVLRHLNIFKRPSSIDGHEWKERHEPEVLLDFEVGLSCLLFLLISVVLYEFGDIYGAICYVVVSFFSTLSDAVYFNHWYLDLADRVTATIGALYMFWYSTQWVFREDTSQVLVWLKLAMQFLTALVPFMYLDLCRQFPVRSENWRSYHVLWHVTGTAAMIFSICVSQGVFDDFLVDLKAYKLSDLLAESPLVDLLDAHSQE